MNWYTRAKHADIDWKALGKGTGIGAALGLGALTLLNDPSETPTQNIQTAPSQNEPAAVQPSEIVEQPEAVEGDPFVARVIFSEAANVSDQERELVASVIKNRINHPGFGMGKLDSMKDVVNQPGAFEAIGDQDNMNWERSTNPSGMTPKEKQVWGHALSLSSGDFKPIPGPSGRPLVYYHDKSIDMPKSWSNKYWKAIKEIETEHFIFYSVEPRN